jgi:glucose-1-phosphatase
MKRKITAFLTAVLMLALPLLAGAEQTEFQKGYTLDKVVVLSRHGVRSPLTDGGSLLGDITPHTWFSWTSGSSELSMKGATLEILMGQYFRQWLESEGLIPRNWRPEGDAVRFYANAKQRTQATARNFSAGMLPVCVVPIEMNAPFDTMDEVFSSKLRFVSDAYTEAALDEIAAMGGEKGMAGISEKLRDAIALVMDVTDMKESEAYQSGKYGDLLNDETVMSLTFDEEPAMSGPIKIATSVADALKFQYYEEADEQKAAFGHELTREDWLAICGIVETYEKMLFTAPLISVNVEHPLLMELKSELEKDGRVFSFLCGHDANIAGVLAALNAEEYALQNTLEPGTPIGGKLTFERYLDAEGKAWYAVSIIYQSTEQLRDREFLSLENPPMKGEIRFEGIEPNADGLISEEDLLNRFQEAIDAFDTLVEDYADAEKAA